MNVLNQVHFKFWLREVVRVAISRSLYIFYHKKNICSEIIDKRTKVWYSDCIATVRPVFKIKGCCEMSNEEYREEIIKLISKVENSGKLKYIYEVIKTYLKSRGV